MTDPTTGSAKATPHIPSIPDGDLKITCPNCQMEVSIGSTSADQNIDCEFCKTPISLQIFPRLTKTPAVVSKGDIAVGGEATCQFFPELKAEVICDECGSFMSEKASVTWSNAPLCLPCFHNLREKNTNPEYLAKLKIWDNRALALLAILPLTLFTAPAALFLLLRFRKEPKGWIPRSSFRWWIAFTLTIIVLLGWIALIIIWIAMLTREMS